MKKSDMLTIEKYGLDFKARGHNLTVYFNEELKKLLNIKDNELFSITVREPDGNLRNKLKLDIIKSLDNIAVSKTENSIMLKVKKLFKLLKADNLLKKEEKNIKKSIKRNIKKNTKKNKDINNVISELEGMDLNDNDINKLQRLIDSNKKVTSKIESNHGRKRPGEY